MKEPRFTGRKALGYQPYERTSKRLVHVWSQNLVLVLVGFFVGTMVAEIGLRLYGFSFMVFVRPDPILGVSLRPGVSGWQTSEGNAYVQINTYGYRDHERTTKKPDGVYRIAVLGDSFVEARHVALDEIFCSILERMLNNVSYFDGKSVEVLNFGVSGYGTAQELLTLRHYVYRFQPDQVLLAFFTGNDIIDNSKDLSHSGRARPYFLKQEDKFILDTSFVKSGVFKTRRSWLSKVSYAAHDYSRLFQLVDRAKKGVLQKQRTQISLFSEPGLADEVYRKPDSNEWKEAWCITEWLLREMHNELKNKGIVFGIVTLSNYIQVYPDSSLRRQFMERLNVKDLFYADLRIKRLGDEEGFPVLNLALRLQAYADQHRVFLHGFKNTKLGVGHWNQTGHRLAATMIAEWLKSNRLWATHTSFEETQLNDRLEKR